MKPCLKCGDPSVYKGHRRCRPCYAVDQQHQRLTHLASRRAYDKARGSRPNPARDRARRYERKFGLTVDEYDRRLSAQGGVCAICARSETKHRRGVVMRLAVDHDHVTGVVRGLLCNSCNLGLGKFDDDPERLRAAALYVGGDL